MSIRIRILVRCTVPLCSLHAFRCRLQELDLLSGVFLISPLLPLLLNAAIHNGAALSGVKSFRFIGALVAITLQW